MAVFPHYTQLDQMDCGPTCLRMIAKYYGRLFSSQFLRDKTQIGKDGVSLLGMSEAAEIIGFRTMGVKISFEKLVNEAPMPCIVHWGQNHFVVVYNIKNSGNRWMNYIKGGRKSLEENNSGKTGLYSNISNFNVSEDEIIIQTNKLDSSPNIFYDIHSNVYDKIIYVADPSKGLISYTTSEFCQHWFSSKTDNNEEGIVLLLEPTPTFFEHEEDQNTDYSFERIFKYLWQYKNLLFQLFLALAVGSGLQLLLPFLTQSIVDVGISTDNLPFIYTILSAQLMLTAGRLSVDFIRSWILLHISTRINLNILSDFFIKLMRLPVSFFDTKQFGDLMQRIGDHNRVESFLTGQTLSVLFSLINIITFSLVLATYSWLIFGVFVISTLIYIVWVALFLRHRRKLDFKRFDVSAKSQSSLVQLIQGMQEIKLAGAERTMRWAWERLQTQLFRLQMRGLALSQYQQAGAFSINEGKNIIIIFLAAQSVITGQLSLGAMLAMQQIIGQLNGPVEQLISFVQGLQDAKISLERLNEIHSVNDEEPIDKPKLDRLPEDKGLQFRNVTFTYSGAGNEPVLQNINFNIPQGKTTAIVGMSGSGKTTLLRLLLKFYEPNKGEIRVGESTLRNISHAMWREQCGVVMQDGFIFSDSIARNIAVGVERIDIKTLDHAIQVANLREFIDSLPSGLHTKIGAEGNGLSQGQRQRILIARAVYKNPQFIFFDEATNSLDANNETIIMTNLDKFFTGRTVIIVAHRLSTVYNADQIVVLNKGNLIECGTHTELVNKRGDYWQLVKNQLELGT